MWHVRNYRSNERWRWWQRIAPHGNRWSGAHRAQLRTQAHYTWWQKLAHVFIPHERNGYIPHAVRHHALAVYSLVIITAKAGMMLGLFLTFPTPAHFSSLTAQRIIALTNAARAEIGIAPLSENALLRESALLKVDEMARVGYFAHTSPRGVPPWEWFKRAGYVYTYAGENLAMDFSNAEEVVDAWMESPRHRENMLNAKYREIGVAVSTGAVNGRTVTLVVQHFGASASSPVPSAFAKSGAVYGAETGAGEVSSAATESKLMPSHAIGWDTAVKVFPWMAGIFALWLAIQLMLTIFIHVRFQHRGIIYATVLVIGIAVGLLYTNVHFLEKMGKVPIVF